MVFTPRTKSRRQILEKRGMFFRQRQKQQPQGENEENPLKVMTSPSTKSFDSYDIEVGDGPVLLISEEADETGSFRSGRETRKVQKEQPDAATGAAATVVTATPSNNTVPDMRQKAKLAHLRHKKYLKEQRLAKLQDNIFTREGDTIDYVFDHVESFVCTEGTSEIPAGNTRNKGQKFLANSNMARSPSYADGDTNSLVAESTSGLSAAEEKAADAPDEPFRIPNSNLLVVVANAENGEIKQQQWKSGKSPSTNNEDYISPTSLSSNSATSPAHQLLDAESYDGAEEKKLEETDMVTVNFNNNYSDGVMQKNPLRSKDGDGDPDVLENAFSKVENVACRDGPSPSTRSPQQMQPDFIEKTCSSFENALDCSSPSKRKKSRGGGGIDAGDAATTVTGATSFDQNSLIETASAVEMGSELPADDFGGKSEDDTSPLKLHRLAVEIDEPDDDYVFETVETFVCREDENGLRGAVKIRSVLPPLHSLSPHRQSAATPTAPSPRKRAKVTLRRDNSLLDELSTNSTEDSGDVDDDLELDDPELGAAGQSKLERIRMKKRWLEKRISCTTPTKGPDGSTQILVPRGYKSPSPKLGGFKTPRSSGSKGNHGGLSLQTSGSGRRPQIQPGNNSDDETRGTNPSSKSAIAEGAIVKWEENSEEMASLCSYKRLEQFVMVVVGLLVVGALAIIGLSFFWPKAKQGI